MCDVIVARVFSHETVTGLAQYASVPVINALCDVEHPTQAVADVLTMAEYRLLDVDLRHPEGKAKGKIAGPHKISFIGDGDNNVTRSLALAVTALG